MNESSDERLRKIEDAFRLFWRQVEIGEWTDHEGHSLLRNKPLKDLKALIEGAAAAADTTPISDDGSGK